MTTGRADGAEQGELARALSDGDRKCVVDAKGRDRESDQSEDDEERTQQVEKRLGDIVDPFVGERRARDRLCVHRHDRGDSIAKVSARDARLGGCEDGRDPTRLVHDHLLRGVEGERRPCSPAEPVRRAEGRNADDTDLDRLGCLDHSGIADVETARLRCSPIDHDLVGLLRCASLDELVRIQFGRGDPTAGLAGRAVATNGLATFSVERSVADYLTLRLRDTVDLAHGVDDRCVDQAAVRIGRAALLHHRRVSHDDIGVGRDVGEELAEVGTERVTEHEGARQERDADRHGDARAEQPALARPQRDDRHAKHQSASEGLHALEHERSGRVVHSVHHATVSEENDRVGE